MAGISVALNADGSNAIIGASVADNRERPGHFQKNGKQTEFKGDKLAGAISSESVSSGLVGSYECRW